MSIKLWVIRTIVFLYFLLLPSKLHHKHLTIDIKQEQCLANLIWHEARGESTKGRTAVASVALNRAYRANSDVCSIVSKPGQFSWYKRNPALLPNNVLNTLLWEAHVILEDYRRGKVVDVTLGATHFANNRVTNYWTKHFKHTITIGKHKFYVERK